MNITKRDGSKVKFVASKVQTRVEKAAKGLNVEPHKVLMAVYGSISDNMTTSEIDNLISEIAGGFVTKHYDYSLLAAEILDGRLRKETKEFFENAIMLEEQGIITKTQLQKYEKFSGLIKQILAEDNKKLDYLGIKTFLHTYALRDKNGVVCETPDYLKIRLAVFFSETEEEMRENMDALNSGYSPPTPTLCNAGTTEGQLASCQLHYLKGDDTDSIMESFKDLANSSRNKAGIGFAAYDLRAKGSKSSKGWGAAGTVQGMKILNEIMRFFDQGGKRPGSTAWYLTPWHKDVFDFLTAKKVTTHESLAARDMFYALWISDEFMTRVENKDKWYLFCPNDLKKAGINLVNSYGEEFSKEYERAIQMYKDGILSSDVVLAEDLWKEIYVSCVETGLPYLGFKDNVNRNNAHRNLGMIKSSNLCVAGDTLIFTDKGYIEIGDLVGEKVNVWNGEEYSEVEIVKTGENQSLLKVSTDSGFSLKCTPYHKFYLKDGSMKRAHELISGDALLDYTLPYQMAIFFPDGITVSRTVTKVERVEGTHTTFCFTEPKRGMGVFNTILAGNCSEIMQYTDPETVAVCFLSSLIVRHYVDSKGNIIHAKLEKDLNTIVRNLNRSIDSNIYPLPDAERGAKQQRAIGIGIQGLADLFFKLGIPYESEEALKLTRLLEEAIHYYTIKASTNYSRKAGKRLFQTDTIYPTEEGKFHWENYNVETTLDWEGLRKDVLTNGVANSMFNCQPPTATSAQMNSSTESYENLTSNVYSRRVNAGDYTVINKYLIRDLEKIGVWGDDFSRDLIMADGSVQMLNIYDYKESPTQSDIDYFNKIKTVYKTVWEVSQKSRTNICIAMQPFIDQAISMNTFYKTPTIGGWGSALFYAWKNGLKTGSYYTRTFKPSANKELGIEKKEKVAPQEQYDFECDNCSS